MEFFGWLTKGRCAVSLLDVLMLVFEIVIVVSFTLMVINVTDYFKNKAK